MKLIDFTILFVLIKLRFSETRIRRALKSPVVLPVLVVLMCLPSKLTGQFAGGSGSETDPWQVETLEQLQAVGTYPDSHFVQIADIDASATAGWNGGKGFEPIGKQGDSFTGSYNGQGHLISNLTINRPDESWLGLFDGIINATIEQLHLEQVDIRGEEGVGALAGSNFGSVNGVSVSGKVSGNQLLGGLIGHNEGTIRFSYADVEVTGKNNRIGGLVGYSYGVVEFSFASGNVTGSRFTGGLVGMNGRHVRQAYATGDVSGSSAVGRLVGGNTGSPDPAEQSIITESYAIGLVSAESNDETGGIAGYNPGRIYRSYWRIPPNAKRQEETGGSSEQLWRDNDPEVLVTGPPVDEMWGLSAGQMTGQNAFVYMYEFDFDETWQLTEGYPKLRWQAPADSVQAPEVAILSVRPEDFDFGEVKLGEVESRQFTLRNRGNITMNGAVGTLSGDTGSFSLTGGEGSYELAPDESHGLDLEFKPERADTFIATLEINHNAANEEDPMQLLLTGIGKVSTLTEEPGRELSDQIRLHQNYPNPFNPVTVIQYELPVNSEVRLEVLDLLGRRVAILVDGIMPAGVHEAAWDGTHAASGVYIYKLRAGDFVQTRSMMLLK
ncbi:choice-of-anchor D domain-containing protein [Natronogracilivirga saccharolytica]|uniref:Choice-of-anchor D domain-containing protein n=1 Tax=Natronogracilivirga saccharolytica TaxID=2812953 RepID=A0A8J7UVJ8_9BACT|nr:choice-of-anchor D domain-containing protein [Natronogracilivirga saccharolytica]MBP3191244.1 choice-of-anchor D domain-containing protein [Natronogracilivirga saccharolytica]